MRNTLLFLLMGLGFAVAGAWWLSPRPAELPPAAAAAGPADVGRGASPATPVVAPPSSEPPPWASAAPVQAAPPQIAAADAPAPAIAQLQERLQVMTRDGRTPEVGELDALLADLQASSGSQVLGGVRLDLLRKNLALSSQMQVLAERIQAQSLRPDGGDRQLMQSDLQQLQALQKQLRLDVIAQPTAQ